MAKIDQDFSIKYDGRAFKFTIVVNTDEPLEEILLRLQRAARGQKRYANVIAAQEVTHEELEALFEAAKAATVDHYTRSSGGSGN